MSSFRSISSKPWLIVFSSFLNTFLVSFTSFRASFHLTLFISVFYLVNETLSKITYFYFAIIVILGAHYSLTYHYPILCDLNVEDKCRVTLISMSGDILTFLQKMKTLTYFFPYPTLSTLLSKLIHFCICLDAQTSGNPQNYNCLANFQLEFVIYFKNVNLKILL